MSLETFEDGYARGFAEGKKEGQPQRTWWKTTLVKILAAMFGIAVAFLTGVATSDTMRNNVCDASPARWEQLILGCPKAHQRVSQAEAQSVIDSYLGMASGAQPERAWYLLSTRMREELGPTQKDFAQDFENTLWIERLGTITPSADRQTFNRFDVRYLRFTGKNNETPDAAVNEYVQEFQIARTGRVTTITDIAPATRSDTLSWVYPAVYTAPTTQVPGMMRGFSSPSVQATNGGDPTLAHGGLLRPLCEVELTDGAWVYAPGSGWIPDEFLAAGSKLADVVQCDAHFRSVKPSATPSPSH